MTDDTKICSFLCVFLCMTLVYTSMHLDMHENIKTNNLSIILLLLLTCMARKSVLSLCFDKDAHLCCVA